jgi:hypothetical protein
MPTSCTHVNLHVAVCVGCTDPARAWPCMYVHVSGGSDERNRDSPMSRGAEAEAEVLGSVEGVLVVLGHTPVSVCRASGVVLSNLSVPRVMGWFFSVAHV